MRRYVTAPLQLYLFSNQTIDPYNLCEVSADAFDKEIFICKYPFHHLTIRNSKHNGTFIVLSVEANASNEQSYHCQLPLTSKIIYTFTSLPDRNVARVLGPVVLKSFFSTFSLGTISCEFYRQ